MISEMARIDLARLRKAGYQPTDEQVIKLNDLALRIEMGKDGSIVNAPRVAHVGNVNLFEPTLAMLDWWHNFGRDSFILTRWRMNAYYFALANARNVELLSSLTDTRAIRRAVKRWAAQVYATDAELWRALLYVKRADGDASGPLGEVDLTVGSAEDDETINRIFAQIIACAGLMHVAPADLKTETPSTLLALLIKASRGTTEPLKMSTAKDYIAYQRVIREIEKHGSNQ